MKDALDRETEIDNDVITKIENYIDDEIKSGTGVHGEFFQIIEDLVLPVLRELEERDIIDDKHLSQHLDERNEYEKKLSETKVRIDEIEFQTALIKALAKEI